MNEKEENIWRREIFVMCRKRRIENEKGGKYLEKGRLEWGVGAVACN